mmetsp:Transcript_14420/g.21012  ORF Transcript_14420/g.21012 Transcript_14420/m.21012 type:complete len:84 (+) Transcript_14420:764-1015(+)
MQPNHKPRAEQSSSREGQMRGMSTMYGAACQVMSVKSCRAPRPTPLLQRYRARRAQDSAHLQHICNIDTNKTHRDTQLTKEKL